LWDVDEFKRRTIIFVGDPSPALAEAFDSLESPCVIEFQECGQPIARWTVVICRGYRGFRDILARASNKGH
jgi:hypothetical protein